MGVSLFYHPSVSTADSTLIHLFGCGAAQGPPLDKQQLRTRKAYGFIKG